MYRSNSGKKAILLHSLKYRILNKSAEVKPVRKILGEEYAEVFHLSFLLYCIGPREIEFRRSGLAMLVSGRCVESGLGLCGAVQALLGVAMVLKFKLKLFSWWGLGVQRVWSLVT